jgi:hypothetical protein
VTTATPILPYLRSSSESRLSLTDKYLLWLCFILLGYALDGRGFAYFFMGEMALIIGALFLVNTRGWTGVFQSPQLLLLLPFWAWGAARTIPFLGTYRLDAVRDAMLWGYSGFAFIIAGLILAQPGRLIRLLQRYGRFAFIFLALIPLVALTYRSLGSAMPRWPFVNIAVIQEKEGDVMVHLAGIFAFWIAGLGGRIKPLWIVLLTANAAVMGVVDRAGQLAFMAAFALCAICRPRHPIIWRILLAGFVFVFGLWVTRIDIPIAAEKGRDISFDQLVTNITSVTTDTGADGLESTKTWRVNWWNDIIHYTIHGRYLWTGKGFGVNLAEDDGYQVLQDKSLRAPHNAHMDILAREGVPGIIIWILLQLGFVTGIVIEYINARIKRDTRWQSVFLFLLCYWLAFVINGSFDVYFEGPMGAVWFWVLFGVGAAAIHLHKRRPEILYVS